MGIPAALPLLVLLIVLGADFWVYADAKAHDDRGAPVTFSIGSFTLDTPGDWFVACLILWILFFPVYVNLR